MSTLTVRKVVLVDKSLAERISREAQARDVSEGKIIRDGAANHVSRLEAARKRAETAQ